MPERVPESGTPCPAPRAPVTPFAFNIFSGVSVPGTPVKAYTGPPTITTMMLRSLPCGFTRNALLEILDSEGIGYPAACGKSRHRAQPSTLGGRDT